MFKSESHNVFFIRGAVLSTIVASAKAREDHKHQQDNATSAPHPSAAGVGNTVVGVARGSQRPPMMTWPEIFMLSSIQGEGLGFRVRVYSLGLGFIV